MQENVYKDPFAAECNQYARKFDDAFNAKDWVTTEHLIAESEELLKLHPNDYAYAPLYYSLGTSFGTTFRWVFYNRYPRKGVALLSGMY